MQGILRLPPLPSDHPPLEREFHLKIKRPKAFIHTFIPDIEVLTVNIGPELGPVVPPIGTYNRGVELRSDINIYWVPMVRRDRGGAMAGERKKRDTETGQSGSGWDRFTQQVRQFRAQHDSSTYMNAEETAEEVEEKKRKAALERMAKQGMR